MLAFGAYNRPTCLEATVQRVVAVSLEDDLERCFTEPESVFAPDADTPPELLEALAASGGDFEGLLEDAAEKMAVSCTAIFWSLNP